MLPADEKEKSSSLIGIAVSIILSTIAASVTYYLTSKADRDKAIVEQRKEAYVAYVSALDKGRISKIKLNCNVEDDRFCQLELAFQLDGGAALRRIGIYGDASVVRATADYKRAVLKKEGDPRSECDSTWELDLEMYIQMRRSVLDEDAPSPQTKANLAELLLPCRLPRTEKTP